MLLLYQVGVDQVVAGGWFREIWRKSFLEPDDQVSPAGIPDDGAAPCSDHQDAPSLSQQGDEPGDPVVLMMPGVHRRPSAMWFRGRASGRFCQAPPATWRLWFSSPAGDRILVLAGGAGDCDPGIVSVPRVTG